MEGLTDLENIFLNDFINNKEMFAAVKKAFELVVLGDSVDVKVSEFAKKHAPTMTDEELGANLRARMIAQEALEVGFSSIAQRKPVQTISPNKAR